MKFLQLNFKTSVSLADCAANSTNQEPSTPGPVESGRGPRQVTIAGPGRAIMEPAVATTQRDVISNVTSSLYETLRENFYLQINGDRGCGEPHCDFPQVDTSQLLEIN